MTNKRGRPRLPGTPEQRRRDNWTNISVPKEVRDKLGDYRAELSKSLGIDLTIAQALKYLINNAEV